MEQEGPITTFAPDGTQLDFYAAAMREPGFYLYDDGRLTSRFGPLCLQRPAPGAEWQLRALGGVAAEPIDTTPPCGRGCPAGC